MTLITFATRWADPSGRVYEGGKTADVDAATARILCARGKARRANAADIAPASDENAPAPNESVPAPHEERAPEPPTPDASTPEPATETEPPGPVESAPTKRRSRVKEVAADG